MNAAQTMNEWIARFWEDFPAWRQAMAACPHGEKGRANPYHLEGDCWSHTMMVCQRALTEGAQKRVALAALLHDLGKPQCREVDPKAGYVRFAGHESLSAFMALDVLKKWYADGQVDPEEISAQDIFSIIALHALPYRVQEVEKLNDKFRYAKTAYIDLLWLHRCDALGRFALKGCFDEERYDKLKWVAYYLEHRAPQPSPQAPVIELLVGPSGSGKSTYVEKKIASGFGGLVLSRDALVMRYGAKESYAECWESLCDEDHKQIDAELDELFENYVTSGKNIIVDMMNLNRESRHRWLEKTPKRYFKKATVFLLSYREILDRSEKQCPYKCIPKEALLSMMKRFEMPLYDEVDRVEFVREQANKT